MSERPHLYVYRGPVPLWLVLAVVAPLGLVFLTSLVLAVAIVGIGAALATLVLPLFWKRAAVDPPGAEASRTIELDPSQYHRVESRAPRGDGE
jgi:hypothetical protein